MCCTFEAAFKLTVNFNDGKEKHYGNIQKVYYAIDILTHSAPQKNSLKTAGISKTQMSSLTISRKIRIPSKCQIITP